MTENNTLEYVCLNHVLGHHDVKELNCYGCKADEYNKHCPGYIPVAIYTLHVFAPEYRENVRSAVQVQDRAEH